MDPIRVFVALISPLWRASLRSTLARARGIALVGEAATADAAAEQLPLCRPHVLIADHSLLTDPAIRVLLAQRDAPHAVAVTIAEPSPAASDLPSIAVLPIAFLPDQWTAELRRIVTPVTRPAEPAKSPPDLRQRFHFTDPPEGSVPGPRVPSVSWPASPADLGRRRLPEGQYVRLVSRLRLLQQRRDVVTGLAVPQALEQAWELLPSAQQSVASLKVEVRDERGAVRAPNFALLRRLSATLQANVRRDDFVCRAGPATFVTVLPGMRREESAILLDRIQQALEGACRQQAAVSGVHLTIESDHWEAGSLPTTAFVRCMETRQGGTASLSSGRA